MGIIYKLNFPSGKSYIGLTVQTLKNRLRAHRGWASSGKNGALHSAMRKYGLRSMEVEILANENDFEKLKLLEIRYIKEYRTKVPHGYNLTDGGDGVLGVIITEECRQNRSVGQRKSFSDPERRRKHLESMRTPEIRKLRSEITKKRMADPEIRKRVSAALKARWKDPVFLEKMKSRPRPSSKINDGLTGWERHRLKNLDAYRKRKREYARTPEQRARRVAYGRLWREKNREKYNAWAREYHKKRRSLLVKKPDTIPV